MVKIHVTQRGGESQTLEAPNGENLMEVLRDENTGVEGTCGGTCSCGTCHVYVAEQWQQRVGGRGEDESMMLEALEEFVELRPGSRLACQVELNQELDGLEVEIAPAVE